jgi:hypothetical protein
MQSEIGHAIAHETPFKHFSTHPFIYAGKILPLYHLKIIIFRSCSLPGKCDGISKIKCQMEAMGRRHRIKN